MRILGILLGIFCVVGSAFSQRAPIRILEQDRLGRTELMFLVAQNAFGEVDQLILRGIDVNQRDHFGQTAVHYAVSNCNPKLFQRFIDAKARLDITDNSGNSLMHKAAISNCGALIGILQFHGVDIQQRNKAGKTPLMLAVEFGNQTTAEVLIRRGANTRMTDNNGQNALHHLVSGYARQVLVQAKKVTLPEPPPKPQAPDDVEDEPTEVLPTQGTVESAFLRAIQQRQGLSVQPKEEKKAENDTTAAQQAQDVAPVDSLVSIASVSADSVQADSTANLSKPGAKKEDAKKAAKAAAEEKGKKASLGGSSKMGSTLASPFVKIKNLFAPAPDPKKMAEDKFLAMLQLLIKHQANMNQMDEEGITPKALAQKYGLGDLEKLSRAPR